MTAVTALISDCKEPAQMNEFTYKSELTDRIDF